MTSLSVKACDITVYGASSFVARYVCEYLVSASVDIWKENNSSGALRVTLAGRNISKLEARKSEMETQLEETKENTCTIDTFVAECKDKEALQKMADRTKVIINCAGPFEVHGGENVIGACILSGNTHYVDITGEIDWAGSMRQKFGNENPDSKCKSKIVSFCGFDSIPSDISVYASVKALREYYDKNKSSDDKDVIKISSATTWHHCMGLMNGGTLHTALNMPLNVKDCLFCPTKDDKEYILSLRRVPLFINDPFILSSSKIVDSEWRNIAAKSEWTNQLPSLDTIQLKQDCDKIRIVSIPFLMAPVNAKVIYASAAALDYSSGTDTYFQYRERMIPFLNKKSTTKDNFDKDLYLSAILGFFTLMMLTFCTILLKLPVVGKKLAMILLPPGSGSPDYVSRNGFSNVYAHVSSSDQKYKATTELLFQGDPGNLCTAQLVVESALCFLQQHLKELPPSTKQFGTPAEVFGDVLIQRLLSNSVRQVTLRTEVWKEECHTIEKNSNEKKED